jgi:hypothetical protein
MRAFLVFALLCCAACRTQPYAFPVSDDGGGPPQSPLDFSTPRDSGTTVRDFGTPTDLPRPRPDLSRPGDLATNQTGCAELAQCLAQCNDQTCSDSCQSQASPAANNQFDQIIACALKHCLAAAGTTPPRCQSQTDQSDTCQTCLGDVVAPLFGGACQDPGPDCNASDCLLQIKMCLGS